jgi:hypothetical protein
MWNSETEKAYQEAAALVAGQARQRKEALAPLREALRLTTLSYNIPEIASALAMRADHIIEALRPFASVPPGDSKVPDGWVGITLSKAPTAGRRALPPCWFDCRDTGRPGWLWESDEVDVVFDNGVEQSFRGDELKPWPAEAIAIRLPAPWRLVDGSADIPAWQLFRTATGEEFRSETAPTSTTAVWWQP